MDYSIQRVSLPGFSGVVNSLEWLPTFEADVAATSGI